MYAVTGMVVTQQGEYSGVRQVPTFFLDEKVQGIISDEQAKRIAFDVIRSGNPSLVLDKTVFITVVKVA